METHSVISLFVGGRQSRRLQAPCRIRFGIAFLIVLLLAAIPGCGSKKAANSFPGGLTKEEYKKKQLEDAKKEQLEALAADQAAKKAKEDKQKKQQEDMNKRMAAASESLNAPTPSKKKAGGGKTAKAAQPAAPTPGAAIAISEDEPDPNAFPPLPAPPSDEMDWELFDFYVARAMGNPNLPSAVRRLGKEKVGDPQTAKAMGDLLTPPLLAGLELDEGSKSSKGDRTKDPAMVLIDALCDALAANATPVARETLRRVIMGEKKTENDLFSPYSAIEALSSHSCKENDELVFEVLSTPQKFCNLKLRPIAPEELRSKAVGIVTPRGGTHLRELVAMLEVNPDTPKEIRDKLGVITKDMSRANMEAHTVLYCSPQTDVKRRDMIERYFADYSESALRDLFSVPPPAADGGGHREDVAILKNVVDPTWAGRVGGQIWTPKFADLVHGRMRMANSLQDGFGPLLLGATVPNDPMRKSVYEMLKLHWEDGPDALRKSGLSTTVLGEPAFSLLLWLVRDEVSTVRDTFDDRSGKAKSGESKSKNKSGDPGSSSAKDAASYEQRKAVHDAWSAVQAELVSRWCKDIYASLKGNFVAGTDHASRILGPTSSGALPFEIHAPQEIRAEFHLNWVEAMKGKLLDVSLDPLFVHYVRTEEKAKPATIRGYYKRQMAQLKQSQLDERALKDAKGNKLGLWMECVQKTDQPGRIRVIHVFIARVNPEINARPDEEMKLTTEVFAIEINDPREKKDARRAP